MDVQEKWWHRLAKITLAGAVVLASLLTVAVGSTTWNEYRERHTWDADWDPSLPAQDCTITLYSEEVGAGAYCGGLFKPIDVYNAMVAARVIQANPDFPRQSEYRQGLAMDATLTRQPQQYWSGSEFSKTRMWTSLGTAFMAFLLYVGIAYGIWSLLLYVAHGPKAKLVR
jgi:hypothetical protein